MSLHETPMTRWTGARSAEPLSRKAPFHNVGRTLRESDSVLGLLFEEYPNMKVVVCPANRGGTRRLDR